ncbi:prepilin-type N-terminal cleavage/methylation domain-containing protein [Ferrimonas marina]|uniref:MSHA pilin protein MshA n=1 Tax=Ferrimonas marina TaxID=299255 RepID=A0A1M5ZER5_9GAMM|nr:prepilin-type N-terminal cleavage/methylation domain-containing protein [Ferrimonas marina]SHI22674.1 MSHA pilin protein MshA [Ferrimonas marina]
MKREMGSKGFTLVELVVVIAVVGMLAATAAPRFISLSTDADQAAMRAMTGALRSTLSMTNMQIQLRPEQINAAASRFTLDSGEQIRLRGGIPDGRWNNTFIHLTDFEATEQVNSNSCDLDDVRWCVRQRGGGWFASRGYSADGMGRGFVIFPYGYQVNNQRCYLYYLNPNATTQPDDPKAGVIGSDFSEC